jgi:hypothetical protein
MFWMGVMVGAWIGACLAVIILGLLQMARDERQMTMDERRGTMDDENHLPVLHSQN